MRSPPILPLFPPPPSNHRKRSRYLPPFPPPPPHGEREGCKRKGTSPNPLLLPSSALRQGDRSKAWRAASKAFFSPFLSFPFPPLAGYIEWARTALMFFSPPSFPRPQYLRDGIPSASLFPLSPFFFLFFPPFRLRVDTPPAPTIGHDVISLGFPPIPPPPPSPPRVTEEEAPSGRGTAIPSLSPPFPLARFKRRVGYETSPPSFPPPQE